MRGHSITLAQAWSPQWQSQTTGQPPVVRELEAVFAAIDADELLAALAGPIRRGPKGYDVSALWR